MKLYGFGNSRSFRIIWMFKELSVDFDYIKLNPKNGDLENSEFLKLNPSGKVPVLIDGDLVLTESAAIVTYLGDKYSQYPQKSDIVIPKCKTSQRAQYNQWCYFALCEFEQPLWTIAKHEFALPEKYHVPAIQRTAIYEFRSALKVLASGLGDNRWVLGKDFSAADILLCHTLHWANENKIKFKNTPIEEYYSRAIERKAFKEALDVAFPH